ncbi:MAG: hypothetical protein HY907_16780 [Deltaproteobacteria bacterium]|nr:hypothetical protein [Deltaproteobacteria bacterium]
MPRARNHADHQERTPTPAPLATLLLLVLPLLPSCSSHPKLECGVELDPGRARFCRADGRQVCICADHRCANQSTTCPSGFAYADDDTCVEPAPAATRIESTGPTGICPATAADADADADVDSDAEPEADGDGPPDGDADEDVAPDTDTDGTDAEHAEDADGGPTTPVVGTPLRLGDGQDPRFVDFQDAGVLVAWTDRYFETSPPPAAPAAAHFGLIGWDAAAPPDHLDSVDAVGILGPETLLRAPVTWAHCPIRGRPGALFQYWAVRPETEPLLFYVSIDEVGALSALDVTGDVLSPTPPERVEAMRIVPRAGGCWVVWNEDADGTGGPEPAQIVARRFDPADPFADSPLWLHLAESFAPNPEWRYWSAEELAGETYPRPSIPYAVVDELTGNLFVAIAAVDPVNHVAALFGQLVDASSPTVLWAADRSLAQLSETDYDGLEVARTNAVAFAQNDAVLALVAVRSTGERSLFYDLEHLRSESSGSLYPVNPAITSFRGPSLAALPPDRVYGAVADWSGSGVPSGPVHFFHGPGSELTATWEALPNSANPWLVADPGTDPDLDAVFVLRAADIGGRTRPLVTREVAETYSLAPGWTDGGVDFAPAGHTIVGDSSHPTLPLPAPDDGGALVGWTNGNLEWAAYVARIRFAE